MGTQSADDALQEQVLVAAPFGCDAEILCRVLEEAGLRARHCGTAEELCEQIAAAAAVAIIAEEFLSPQNQHRLQETLSAQPEWSHLPLIIMAAERRSSCPPANLDEFIHSTHAVRLLRPVRKLTLVSSVRAALNSRARQYQVRDELFQRRRVEEALRQSEERYRRLVGLLPVGVYTCSAPSGAITFFNDQAVRLWGRAPRIGDLDSRFCGSYRLWLPDGRELKHEQTPMAVTLREGTEWRNQSVVVERPDGTRINVLVNIDPIRDPEGRVVGAINAFHDTTELTRMQTALRESEQRYRALVESQTESLVRFRPDGTILFANAAYSRTVGVHPDEVLGRSFWTFIPEEDQPSVRAMLEKLTPDCPEVSIENRLDTAQGQRWTLWTNRALSFDSEGRLLEAQSCGMDITDRKEAELALREADRRKDEFLAMLAHELRNPLAPIRSGLELMKMVGDDPVTMEEVRSTMERQTQQLITLVDDLLDVSRITRGKLELRKKLVPLADVVRNAVETCRPLIDQAGHELSVSLPEVPVTVEADPGRLAQVFSNLLNNATKYTRAGGRIGLSASVHKGHVTVEVADNGMGIPADALERIFEMFAQLEGPAEKGNQGLGIGLTLVKSLVEMHDGTIEVHSGGEGRGSRFRVRLPIPVTVHASNGATAAAPTKSVSKRPHRVLVVDDNSAAAQMLSLMVQMLGNEVRTASDGVEAVRTAAEFRPEMILMDLGMPRMNGLEAARRIRSHEWGQKMLLVALTGWGQEEDRRRTLDSGFDHHLVKPAEPEVLEKLITQLGSKGSQQLETETC